MQPLPKCATCEHNGAHMVEAAETMLDERLNTVTRRLRSKITEDFQAIKAHRRALENKITLIGHSRDSSDWQTRLT